MWAFEKSQFSNVPLPFFAAKSYSFVYFTLKGWLTGTESRILYSEDDLILNEASDFAQMLHKNAFTAQIDTFDGNAQFSFAAQIFCKQQRTNDKASESRAPKRDE